jgi:hypothetical protein
MAGYANYNLELPNGLKLKYMGTEIFLGTTPYTDLYMNMYMPLSSDTEYFFNELYKNIGPSCEEFWQYSSTDKLEKILKLNSDKKHPTEPEKNVISKRVVTKKTKRQFNYLKKGKLISKK